MSLKWISYTFFSVGLLIGFLFPTESFAAKQHYVCTYIDASICQEKCIHVNHFVSARDESRSRDQFSALCDQICNDSDDFRNCTFQHGENVACSFLGHRYEIEIEAERQFLQDSDERYMRETERAKNYCRNGGEIKKTTALECNFIQTERYHPNCTDLDGEVLDQCIAMEYDRCIANCENCLDSEEKGTTIPFWSRDRKPTGYDGPIPDCAFTADGCREVNALLVFGINIAQWLFGVIGSLALLRFVYGGYRMVVSFGSPEGFKAGKAILLQAVVGMLIAFGALIGVEFFLDVLQVQDAFRLFP